MKSDLKSVIKFLAMVAILVAAGYVAYQIYQYVMMYVVGKAVVGASSEALRGFQLD